MYIAPVLSAWLQTVWLYMEVASVGVGVEVVYYYTLGGSTPTSVTQGLFGRRPVTQGLRQSRRPFFGSPKAPQAKYARSPKAFSNSETVDTQGTKAQCPPRGVNVGVLGLRSRTKLHDEVHGVLKIRIYRIE